MPSVQTVLGITNFSIRLVTISSIVRHAVTCKEFSMFLAREKIERGKERSRE